MSEHYRRGDPEAGCGILTAIILSAAIVGVLTLAVPYLVRVVGWLVELVR